MNLAEIEPPLKDLLLRRKEMIALFVYRGSLCWVIDWDEHFNLDHMKNIDSVTQDKKLLSFLPEAKTPEQYRSEVIQRYRNGIPTLTPEMFGKYREGPTAKIVSNDALRKMFFEGEDEQFSALSKEMERELSFNTPMSEDLVGLRVDLDSMLPKFYINYDRRIFMHMVKDRSYETSVLDGWWGAQADFEHMVPTSHRYWVRNTTDDFWAVTNFSNG